MKRLKRFRISPGTIIAMVALFVAMGGSAYALTLPDGSVGTAQLRNHAVTQTKLAARAVTPSRLRNHAVVQTKLAPNAVTSSRIRKNAVGSGELNKPKLGDLPSTFNYGVSAVKACDPTSTTLVDCGTIKLKVAHRARVALIADAQWFGAGTGTGTTGPTGPSGPSGPAVGGPASAGTCQLVVDGKQVGSTTTIGEAIGGLTDAKHPATAGMNTVTDPIKAGDHTFGVVCNETEGNIDLPQVALSIVTLDNT